MPSPAPKNGFVGTDEAMTRPYKCHHFWGGSCHHPPLEKAFLGVDDAMNRP